MPTSPKSEKSKSSPKSGARSAVGSRVSIGARSNLSTVLRAAQKGKTQTKGKAAAAKKAERTAAQKSTPKVMKKAPMKAPPKKVATSAAATSSECHNSFQQILPSSAEVMVKIMSMSGEVSSISTSPATTLGALKDQIYKDLGHAPHSQRLLMGETLLTKADAVLADLGIDADCTLSLAIMPEPIGQSSLASPHGKKSEILPSGYVDLSSSDKLNEFELMSWRAVCEGHKAHPETLFMDWTENTGDFGHWSPDLYWTTRSDGCRYEYWSSAPGDNEYGVLVRVDADSMVAIGYGSDDGLEIFADFVENDVVKELINEGWRRWPRFAC